MTRVLHVVQTLKGGGAETLVRNLLPRMRARGVDVEVATVYPSNLTPEEKAALRAPVHELNRRNRLDFSAPFRLWKLMNRLKPGIVHTHVTTGKYWGRLCAVVAGVPTIVHTEHSPDPRLEFWERPLSWFLNTRTTAIVTFSERTAAFIRRRENTPRTLIIPNGIQISAPPNNTQRVNARSMLQADNMMIVGVVASLYPLKNHELATRAFTLLPEATRRKARLDIFGTGPLEETLKGLVQQLGIDRHVVFHGFRTDVHRLMAGFDIFLSVALGEAAPISFLEAMSALVPIVATPSIGALDMVEDGLTGLIAKSWDPTDVASALNQALSDEAWRRDSAKRGWSRLVSTYDIEQTVDKYIELYQRASNPGLQSTNSHRLS